MLGQFVRFYAPYLPALLVLIIQAHYSTSLFTSGANKTPSSTFFILNTFNVPWKFHVSTSIYLALLTTILPSIGLFDNIDSLASEKISFNGLIVFLLYWIAYSILNLFSLIVSVTVYGLNSTVFNRIAWLNNDSVQFMLALFHLLFSAMLGFYVATLTLASLLVYQLLSVARARSKQGLEDRSGLFYLETKLILSFLLVGFNAPGLVVWVKMHQEVGSVLELRRMSAVMEDVGIVAALVCVAVHFIDTFLANRLSFSSVRLRKVAQCLLVANSLLSLLYGIVSFYRLQYFVLVHVALACVEILGQPRTKADLKKD
jgi:hypothetical protein